MARRDSYIAHLREVPIFEQCSKKDLNEIAKLTTDVTFPEGKVIMKQGALASSFVIILSGSATVRRDGRKLKTLGPGDYFGELAVLLKRPRQATVTADESLNALVVDRRELSSVLDDVPGLAKKMLYSTADRLAQFDRKSIN